MNLTKVAAGKKVDWDASLWSSPSYAAPKEPPTAGHLHLSTGGSRAVAPPLACQAGHPFFSTLPASQISPTQFAIAAIKHWVAATIQVCCQFDGGFRPVTSRLTR